MRVIFVQIWMQVSSGQEMNHAKVLNFVIIIPLLMENYVLPSVEHRACAAGMVRSRTKDTVRKV